MATVVNFIDTTLQSAPYRSVNLPTADVILIASANTFSVAGGAGTPGSITFTASLIDVAGAIVFTCTGGTLTSVTATSATLTFANMSAGSATVTATVTANGTPYSDSRTVNKVQVDAATWASVSGTGKPADNATVNTVLSGLLSARPTGGNGDLYYATDTKILYQKVAASWVSGPTSGAPAGTPIGSTDAATVEANANNAIPNASQAVTTDNIANNGVSGVDVFSSIDNTGFATFVLTTDSKTLVLATVLDEAGGAQGYSIDKFVSGTTWTNDVASYSTSGASTSNLYSLTAGTYRIRAHSAYTGTVTNVTILKIKK